MAERIVFVTFELYPFTKGGIGRAIHNIVDQMTISEKENTTVIVVGEYGGHDSKPQNNSPVEVIFADVNDEHGLTDFEATYPPRWAYSHTEWHWRSFVAMRALRDLSNTYKLKYVEFTDWGGLAFCSTQEKSSGNLFQETLLAIRLHGPHAVLLNSEDYAIHKSDLAIYELERKALLDCDLVITQSRPYLDIVRSTFNFDNETWRAKSCYSPLPVLIDYPQIKTWQNGHRSKKILFTSKFQHVKRPELFARGAARFLDRQRNADWEAVFIAAGSDVSIRDSLLQAVPSSLHKRYSFMDGVQGRERDFLIAQSIVVISSECESFCLAAYEASLLGAAVVLNGNNPSFNSQTSWIDNLNCFKFDGSAAGLANAISRAVHGNSTAIKVDNFQPTWNFEPTADQTVRAGVSAVVIIYDVQSVSALIDTLASVSKSQEEVDQVVVLMGGNLDGEERALLSAFEEAKSEKIKLIYTSADCSQTSTFRALVSEIATDAVVAIRAGQILHEKFLKRSVQALKVNKKADYVMSHVGLFSDNPPTLTRATPSVMYKIQLPDDYFTAFLEVDTAPPIVIRTQSLSTLNFIDEYKIPLKLQLKIAFAASKLQGVVLNGVYCFENGKGSIDDNVHYLKKSLRHHSFLRHFGAAISHGGSSYLLDSYRSCLEARLVEEARQAARDGVTAHRADSDISAAILNAYLDGRRPLKSRMRIMPRGNQEYALLRDTNAFDAAWYLDKYLDVKLAGMDPLKHYLQFGASEGRWPNPYFDGPMYTALNPDVTKSGLSPLAHYITVGRSENRPVS